MGDVWSGTHRLQQRRVAVKLLTSTVTREPRFLAAFRNEIRAAAALDHPNIVRVYEFGEATEATEASAQGRILAGTPYLAMELAPGAPLTAVVGRLTWDQLRGVILGLLDALAHAHARGVIHRDLKPGNVLYAPTSGVVKLTDFGLAHAVEGHLASAEHPFYGGTPAYMAPEQFGGRWRDYGPWTDLYGFGCLVFALVRGSPPFGGTTSYEEKHRQHLSVPPPPLAPPVPVPAGFESWLRRLLEKDPSARFRRAADATWAFLDLGRPDPITFLAPLHRGSDEDTLVLPTLGGPGAPPTVGDATTMALPPEELGEISLTLASAIPGPPPLPVSWRHPLGGVATPSMLATPTPASEVSPRAIPPSLGLFGLRLVPLVGREAQRDALWAALADVRRDRRARLVTLTGPDGCGKTHLARWLCERAHELGAAIVLRATHGPIPGPTFGLGPAVGAFLRCQGLSRGEVLDRVEAIFRSHGVEHLDEWLALTEVISPAVGEEVGAIRFGSVLERHVTVRRLVQAITVERPVVLWLDDVQWGLDALRFVEYLLERQRLHPIPVLVIATANATGLKGRRDEATLLAQLHERDDARRIEVDPLPEQALRELVRGLLGLDPALAVRVEARSGGNPLFAVQLVGDWVERGALELGPHGLRLRPDAATELPADVRALWASRIERVLARRTPAEALALELAAVLGTEVDADEWLAVCERSGFGSARWTPTLADPSEALLDDLLNARLADAGAGGPANGWSFTHVMLREHLERRAAAAGRLVELHAVCADVLLDRADQRGGALPSGLAERLGHHLIASGQAELALQPLLDAARARLDLADYAAAAALLDRREAAMRELATPADDPRWGAGWLLRHDVARGQGHFDDADAALDRAQEAAGAHGWMEVTAQALTHRARKARLAGDLEAALAHLDEVERLAELLADRRLRGHARWEAGRVLAEHGELEEGEAAIRDALADAEDSGDVVGGARAWQALGETLKESGRHEEAANLLRQAELLFEECGNRWGMASAINSQGDVARYTGDLAEADALYRRARGLLRAIGSPSWIFAEFNLGQIALSRGDATAARGSLERGMEAFAQQGIRSATVGAHLCLAACAALEQRWLEWDEHLEQARELLRDSGVADEDNARAARIAGDAAADAGQVARARDAYVIAEGLWSTLGRAAEVARVQWALQILDAARR